MNRFIMSFLSRRRSTDALEHLLETGAFVLAPVHRSYVDTPIACCVTRRRLRYMGKDTLWKHKAMAWFASALGGFPVVRGTADREALRACQAVIERGEPLAVMGGVISPNVFALLDVQPLLGRPFKERDWVVVGATPEQMIAQGFRPVGRDFPVFLHPVTKEEYALARTERKTAPGYRGFAFHADPSVTLEQDLERRDLTA